MAKTQVETSKPTPNSQSLTISKENKSPVIINNEIAVTSFSSIDDMLAFATKIKNSNLCPDHLTKAEDVVLAILKGKELGIGAMSALDNIYPINGKTSLSVHLILKRLREYKVYYTIKENYVQVFSYLDRAKNVHTHNDVFQHLDKYEFVNADYFKNKGDSTVNGKLCIVRSNPIDIVTVVEFKRFHKLPDGKFFEEVHTQSFFWTDIIKLGLNDKDNYKKQPKTMLLWRCMTAGQRVIAPEVTFSTYAEFELFDMENVEYDVTDEGEVIIEPIN